MSKLFTFLRSLAILEAVQENFANTQVSQKGTIQSPARLMNVNTLQERRYTTFCVREKV